MSPNQSDHVIITVQVTMGAPSFVPGSLVTSTITMRADRPSSALSSSRSTNIPATTPLGVSRIAKSSSHTPAATSATLSGFGSDSPARANYVVCEFSGRWSSDRSWVRPYAHQLPNGDALDNHRREPVAERPNAYAAQQSETPLPWTAALADANSVGGGGRPGHTGIIFRSQALVVCEREQIPVGSQVSFAVDCVLPDSLPPTLRGSAMRYTYALVVAVAFPGCADPKVVRVPFRVVSAGGTADDLSRSQHIIPVPVPRGVGPLPNRFLEEKNATALTMSAALLKSAPPDDIEIALALSLNGRLTPYKADVDHRNLENDLQDGALSFIRDVGTSASVAQGVKAANGDSAALDNNCSNGSHSSFRKKKNPIPIYGISYGRHAIARMHLSKRTHHLGDTISAIFYFNGDRSCYRLGARLECQEVIQKEFAMGQKHSASNDASQPDVVFRQAYGEHGEFVMTNRNTHVTFSIPHDAPASFSTRVVAVRWLIHFVFLIPSLPANSDSSHENELAADRSADEIESLVDELQISENGTPHSDVRGWEGGTWSGEDSKNWTHLPQKDVDVLRWTLPIVVSGRHNSQWGVRSTAKLVYPH